MTENITPLSPNISHVSRKSFSSLTSHPLVFLPLLCKMEQRGPRLLEEGAPSPRVDRFITIRTTEIIFPHGCPCHPEQAHVKCKKPSESGVQSLPGLPWKRRESQNSSPAGSAANSTLGDPTKSSKTRPWDWMLRKASSSSTSSSEGP